MMRHARVVAVLLLLSLAFCGGGGGGGGGNDGPDDALREREPNDTIAGALDLGAIGDARVKGAVSATGNDGLFPTGDEDLVRFEAATSGWIRVELEMSAGSDLDLALLDASGDRLATSRVGNIAPGVGAIERLSAPVVAGASYHVSVGGFAGTGGDYVLDLEIERDANTAPIDPGRVVSTPVGLMAVARCFHATAALQDGRALVAGGTRDARSQAASLLSAESSTEIFDPVAGTFSAGPSLSGFRFGPTGTTLPDGTVLIVGGDLGATADLFDPRRDAMAETGIPLVSGLRFLHSATLLTDGRVLLVGGVALVILPSPSAPPLATTEIFDPKTRSFSAGPTLPATRFSHAACLLADGRVLVTGGEGRADSMVVDAIAGTASAGPTLSGIRDDHTATLLADGRILVAGGQGSSGVSLDSAEILDDTMAGAASSFRLLAARMGERRADQQALRHPSGSVVLLGGEDDPGNGSGDAILVSVELLDPATETFATLTTLSVGRDDHRVVRLRDGRLLVTGGEDAASVSIRDAEVYDIR